MNIIAQQNRTKLAKGEEKMGKKVTIDKNDLYALLNGASKFFPKKATVAILDCYKIDVTPTAFKVTVSSTDASIERSIPIMGFDTFEACVDRSILGMIGKCPSGSITLEFMEYNTLEITAGKAVFKVALLDSRQYPALPKTEEGEGVSVSAKEFEELLKGVEFALAENAAANKTMTSVNLRIKDGKLTVTALDGYRIAIQTRNVKSELDVDINVPAMSKFINSMDSNDDIQISWDNSHVVMTSSDCKVVCRLIEGNFFNVDGLLKRNTVSEVTIDRESFMGSLERAALMSKGDSSKSPVVVELEDEIMILQMEEVKGKFVETLLGEHGYTKSGSNLRLGFNTKYLLEALNKISDKTVKLLFSGKNTPLFIKSADREKEESYSHIIVPVNINR